MLLKRLIPCLLLKGNGLVKTVNFKNPKYVGDPINTVKIFNEKEVDELVFLDIEATPKGKEPNYKMLAEIANECFMPLAYGGGIKTFDQAQRIFNIGIEKVVINSAAYSNPKLISQIAEVYGNQAIIASVDVKKSLFGKVNCVSEGATVKQAKPVVDWVKQLEEAGAGEILITSVDKEGTWEGFDYGLIEQVVKATNLPVIAHGGAGKVEDVKKALHECHADAVALGSMVVYQKKDFGVLINFPNRDLI